MIRFLRKLWKDRRGNALVIAGAALPVLVGAAGLATDTVQWALTKRQLQRAADSAALAAAYQEAQGQAAYTDPKGKGATSGTCTSADSPTVYYDLTQNDHSGLSPSCTVTTPVTWNGTSDSKAVKVSLTATAKLTFASMFLTSAPSITASATATMVDDGSYCLVALSNTTSSGITIGGSATANLGCGAISDSTSSTAAISTNGSSYSFQASPIAAVGGMPSSFNGCTSCTLDPYHVAEPDPYAGQYSTSVPSGTSCTGFTSHDYKDTNKKTVHYMSAGCYSGFSPSGGDTYYLDAGTYYLNNTDFNPGGGVTIIGTGVTIILTGTSPGSISLDGNETVKLSAPTSGTYKNMLFIQSSSATTNNVNKINGNSGSYFDGAIYEPQGQIQFNGSSGAMTQCAMVVGWTETFSGNTNLQNSLTRPDGTACTNNTTVAGKRIRLVA
jgi:Flp pilus assembly protein TadG